MSACAENFDTPAFFITVLKLFVEMLLNALHHPTVFLLQQHFTFAVVSLSILHLPFKLFHQSMYCSFTNNPNNDNPSSKLAAASFMGLVSYKYYHKKTFSLHCISYSRKAKPVYFPQKVFFVSTY